MSPLLGKACISHPVTEASSGHAAHAANFIMTLNDLRALERPDLILSDLIALHGARPMVLAMLRALTRRKTARSARGLRLSAHLMRDIGLEPLPEAPPWVKIR